MAKPDVTSAAIAFTQDMIDKQVILETGYLSLIAMAYPGAPPSQLAEMRNVFFAGAHHLFASIMCVLDPDSEPTERDMMRLSAINAELERFIQRYKLTHLPAEGSA